MRPYFSIAGALGRAIALLSHKLPETKEWNPRKTIKRNKFTRLWNGNKQRNKQQSSRQLGEAKFVPAEKQRAGGKRFHFPAKLSNE
jgi:hypothetical protein